MTPRLLPWLLLAPLAAAAAPVTYVCEADQTSFDANFTPDRVHLQMQGHSFTLARVPAAGAARYQDAKAGLALVTSRRKATLTIGPRVLECEFTVKP